MASAYKKRVAMGERGVEAAAEWVSSGGAAETYMRRVNRMYSGPTMMASHIVFREQPVLPSPSQQRLHRSAFGPKCGDCNSALIGV